MRKVIAIPAQKYRWRHPNPETVFEPPRIVQTPDWYGDGSLLIRTPCPPDFAEYAGKYDHYGNREFVQNAAKDHIMHVEQAGIRVVLSHILRMPMKPHLVAFMLPGPQSHANRVFAALPRVAYVLYAIGVRSASKLDNVWIKGKTCLVAYNPYNAGTVRADKNPLAVLATYHPENDKLTGIEAVFREGDRIDEITQAFLEGLKGASKPRGTEET